MPISAQPSATTPTAITTRRASARVHSTSSRSANRTANGTRKKPRFSIAFATSAEYEDWIA